jgi:hypothetical protein
MAAAERFFTKLTQDVLDATERIANHLDENIHLFWPGSTTTTTTSTTTETNDFPMSHENEYDNDDDIASMDHTNPLQGMADQVLSGIMEGQVR